MFKYPVTVEFNLLSDQKAPRIVEVVEASSFDEAEKIIRSKYDAIVFRGMSCDHDIN